MNFSPDKKWQHNPFLLFLPFLLIYILIVCNFPPTGKYGDEIKYLELASNLLKGYYSLQPPNIYLGNGPGYPIILIPFIALKFPLVTITLFNAFLVYFSIILLYKSVGIVSKKYSFTVAVFWAINLTIFEYITHIYTEIFTAFLITVFLFSVIRLFKLEKNRSKRFYILVSGIAFGYLALTKPIFGYVLMVMLLGNIVLILLCKNIKNYKKSLFVLVIAFCTTIPYLIFTYSVTKKIFYWGTSGGNNLYWMTTPYPQEFGSWSEYPPVPKKTRIPGSENIISKLHQKDFEKILKFNGVERDSIFREIAENNIQSHPAKFLENCISNVGRMLFNFPYSYKLEKPETLLRLPENGIILLFVLFSIIPTLINWKKVIFPLKFLLFFTFLYLGGSILGSAETRMFSMIVPILLFWIVYIIDRTIKVKLKF